LHLIQSNGTKLVAMLRARPPKFRLRVSEDIILSVVTKKEEFKTQFSNKNYSGVSLRAMDSHVRVL